MIDEPSFSPQRRSELPGRRKPYLMAHRGNKRRCPENTVAAFRRAVADGADLVETDVRLTMDGAFVCLHDATVDRTTDGRGPVDSMTLEEVRRLSASCGNPAFAGERVPTLEEYAATLPPDVGAVLELKTDSFLEHETCARLGREIERLGLSERTLVISFRRRRAEAFRAAVPGVRVGLISLFPPWPPAGFDFLGPVWPLVLLNPFYVRRARSRGQTVCPLDTRPGLKLWYYSRLRCDAVVSDDPGATHAWLVRHGGRDREPGAGA